MNKQDKKLKVTFEYPDRELTASINEHSTIAEVVEILKGLLLAAGFHTDTINDYFHDE